MRNTWQAVEGTTTMEDKTTSTSHLSLDMRSLVIGSLAMCNLAIGSLALIGLGILRSLAMCNLAIGSLALIGLGILAVHTLGLRILGLRTLRRDT